MRNRQVDRESSHSLGAPSAFVGSVAERVAQLTTMDWSYREERTHHELHEIHPYPAKFIPEIPRRLIEAFCPHGGVVLDPFCGSGTTLAEASLLGRSSIGIDVSPLATLIAAVKSTPLAEAERGIASDAISRIEAAYPGEGRLPLAERAATWPVAALEVAEAPASSRGRFRGIDFWFEPHVLSELAALHALIDDVSEDRVRALLRVALSAIVIQVSKQDSDTRYVRRDKAIQPGETTRRFANRARATLRAVSVLDPVRNPCGETVCADSRDLNFIAAEIVDFVVTSPPYPNAWSYHLYHQNRMLVLGMNPWTVKSKEIGSHRQYSAKKGADRSTFLADMSACMGGIAHALKPSGVVAVVIGPSIVRGEVIDNGSVVVEAGLNSGLRPLARIEREIDSRRKAFNPTIGRIRSESVILLQRDAR